MTDERRIEADLDKLKRHTAALAEHFDTVQIFTTRHEPAAGTVHVTWGAGNYFARIGQVKAWITQTEEGERDNMRGKDKA